MRALLPTILTLLALIGAACNGMVGRGDGDDNRFSDFADIAPSGWLYSEPVDFVPDTLLDSICPRGTLLVSVRHSRQYVYSNLWLEVSYADTDTTRRVDTVNVILARPDGSWLGKGMGLSMEKLDTVATGYPLVMCRPLRLRHIMRTDTLEGIERVGLVYIPD